MTDEQRSWLHAMLVPGDPAKRGADLSVLPLSYIRDHAGVDLAADGEFRRHCLEWSRRRTRNPDLDFRETAPLTLVDDFMDKHELLWRKVAAAHWGVTDASFALILDACRDIQLTRDRLEPYPGVAARNAEVLLIKSAPGGGLVDYADDASRRFEAVDKVFSPLVGRRLERLACGSPKHAEADWDDVATTSCVFTFRPLCRSCARSFKFDAAPHRFPVQVDVAFYLENPDELFPYKFGRWLDPFSA